MAAPGRGAGASALHILAAVRDLTRLELVTEATRAALEEVARQAPIELIGLLTDDWRRRYGRAARLGKNPTPPKTRIKNTGDDAYLLLRYTRLYLPKLCQGEQMQALPSVPFAGRRTCATPHGCGCW